MRRSSVLIPLLAKSYKQNTEETDTDLTRKNITQNQDPKSLAKQKMIHALPPQHPYHPKRGRVDIESNSVNYKLWRMQQWWIWLAAGSGPVQGEPDAAANDRAAQGRQTRGAPLDADPLRT